MSIDIGRGKDMTGMKIGRLRVVGLDHKEQNSRGENMNFTGSANVSVVMRKSLPPQYLRMQSRIIV